MKRYNISYYMQSQGFKECEPEFNRDLTESLFLLKKSSDTATTTMAIEADFSPQSKKASLQSTEDSAKTIPVFNLDNKYYTPCFVLDLDKKKYQQNQNIYLTLHHRKTAQIAEQKIQLFVPKPSKNNSYCCICKTPFEDYLTHLTLPKHQFLLKKSDFRSKIVELCASIRGEDQTKSVSLSTKKKRERKPIKQKKIGKERQKKAPKMAKVKEMSQTNNSSVQVKLLN